MNDVQELLLIRHGTTDMAGKLCGHLNPPLNAVGRDQARSLVSLLGDRKVRKIYTSDLLRAVQTAEFLANGMKAPIIVRSDLREISFGDWEGKRWSEIRANLPSLSIQNFESSQEVFAPGAESFLCFQERAIKSLKRIAGESNRSPIVIVTHMGVIRVAMRHLAAVDDATLHQPINPCCVYRFVVTGDVFEYTGEITSANSSSQFAQHG